MHLDTRTLLLVMWLNVTVMSMALFVGVGRNTKTGLRAWNAALIIQMLAWALFIAGMEPIHKWLIVVSVGLLSGSLVAMYITVQRFVGQPVNRWFVGLTPPLVAISHEWVFEDFALRVAHINLILCAQMFWLAWQVLRQREVDADGCRWRALAGGSFVVSGLFVLARAGLVIIAPEEFPRFDQDHWLHVAGLLVNNASLTAGTLAFLLAHRDVSEQALQRLATTDPLTGLHNRRWVEERGEAHLNLAKRHQQPMAVMMIDIDHFKRVNDTHGHQVGDAVLRCFGQILQRVARDTDLVARLGGEEFAVLFPMSSMQAARELDARLRATLAVEMTKELGWFVTYSAGCTQPTKPTDTLQTLFARADELLYQAKHHGRNQTNWSSD